MDLVLVFFLSFFFLYKRDRRKVRTEEGALGEFYGFSEATHWKVYESSVTLFLGVEEIHE